jgi:hypothetical protein
MNPRSMRVRSGLPRSSWLGLLLLAACGAPVESSDHDDVASNRAAVTAAQVAPAAPAASADPRVQTFLDEQYKASDVRHSFNTRHGQHVDCVDFAAQPSLKLPELQGTAATNVSPRFKGAAAPAPVTDLNDGTADENGNTRLCPDGSVPIIPFTHAGIARAGGLDAFKAALAGKHAPPHRDRTADAAPSATEPPVVAGYHYALGVDMNLPAESNLFESTLAIFDPFVSSGTANHSISQIWGVSPGGQATSGCVAPNCLQSLEAGWNVDYSLYNDGNVHFFTYSTRDGYGSTGCYNLIATCGSSTGSGFVMLSGAPVTPGQIILDSLVGGDPQRTMSLAWYTSTDNRWYLAYNGTAIGYIPTSIFANNQGGSQPLSTGFASIFEAGGEVYDSLTNGAFTTDMGSGQPQYLGYDWAAYQESIQYGVSLDDGSGDSQFFNAPISSVVTDPLNYSESSVPAAGGANWGTYFYFGGSGALPAPTGLTAKGSAGAITLTWNAEPGSPAPWFTLFRSTSPSGPWTSVAVTSLLTFKDTGVTTGTTYFYRMYSFSTNDAQSQYSSIVSASPVPPPSAPTGVTESASTGKVTIKWKSVSGAAFYDVLRGTKSGGPYTQIAQVTSTSYVDTAVTHGTQYYYVVVAGNSSGLSPNSSQVSAKP